MIHVRHFLPKLMHRGTGNTTCSSSRAAAAQVHCSPEIEWRVQTVQWCVYSVSRMCRYVVENGTTTSFLGWRLRCRYAPFLRFRLLFSGFYGPLVVGLLSRKKICVCMCVDGCRSSSSSEFYAVISQKFVQLVGIVVNALHNIIRMNKRIDNMRGTLYCTRSICISWMCEYTRVF